MGTCLTCWFKPTKKKKKEEQVELIGLEEVLHLIRFNVGKILYLRQVKPLEHHYAIQIIDGNFLVVKDMTTDHEEDVDLEGFISKFGGCQWAKFEGLSW